MELLRRRKIDKKPSGPKVRLQTEQARAARERVAKARGRPRTQRAAAATDLVLGYVFLTQFKKQRSRVGAKFQAEIPALQPPPTSMRATDRVRAGSRADGRVCMRLPHMSDSDDDSEEESEESE